MSNLESPQPFSALGRPRSSIRRRLLIGSLLSVGLLILAATLIFWQVGRLLGAIEILETASQRTTIVSEVRTDSTALLGTISRLIPLEDSRVFVTEVTAVLQDLEESQGALRALAAAEEDEEIAFALDQVGNRVDSVLSISQAMVRQAEDDQWTSVRVRVGVLNRDQQQINAEINRLVEQVRAREQVATREVEGARRDAVVYPLLIGALALLVTVGALVDQIRRIVGPVASLTSGAGRLASGFFDERVEVASDDEMGQLAHTFNAMAEHLQHSYGVLEERVEERTRDLALAAELGQRLSRVRDVETLLNEAVERIRERFELYYTQVYLTDRAGQTLILFAGTGTVGAELVRRGFRLPISRGSINGSAALDKEAVIIPDTADSPLFRPNPLLPNTRSEMAIPLLIGEDVVGVLDLQSDRPEALTADILPAFTVLAGQLAIAIENARLFTEAKTAREEVAHLAQQRVRQGWDAFLNAVDRSEFIGFGYSGMGVDQLEEPLDVLAVDTGKNLLMTSIVFNEEEIGAIELEASPDLHWTAEHLDLVNGVAQQVAQQVENLRLLAEAERYRDEAEAALQRVTHEGWASYWASQSGSASFVYDGRTVQPASPNPDTGGLVAPLQVRGETIGRLNLPQGEDRRAEGQLIMAVADRLSSHIDNLRLAQQTEQALAEAERRSSEQILLNEIVTNIAATLNLRESLQIVTDALMEVTPADQIRVALLNPAGDKLIVVTEAHDPARTPSALGLEIPVEGNALTQEVMSTRRPMIVSVAQKSRLTRPIRAMLKEQGIETLWILPIIAGNEVVGTIGLDLLAPEKRFSKEDERLGESIVFQAGTAIQSARLFEQVQETLALTERLYTASARINEATDLMEAVGALGEGVPHPAINRVVLFLFEHGRTGELEAVVSHASWYSGEGPSPLATGHRYEDQAIEALRLLETAEPLLVNDVARDDHLEHETRSMLQALSVGTLVVVPLWARNRQLGSLALQGPEPYSFNQQEIEPFVALTGQLALALDRQALLEAAQRRADRERLINVIGQKIQNASTIESAMQVALTELSQALQARRAYVELKVAATGNGEQETTE